MSSTLFTSSCKWQGPEDSEIIIYLAGTTQEVYLDLELVDSLDPDYTANTAFYFKGTEPDILGRKIYPNSTDIITIIGVGESINFGVDDSKGLLIVDSNYPLSNYALLSAKLVRNYASIFSANAVNFNKILDMQFLKERAITSMLPISNGIYLSGVSGNIWFYNGDYIKGPIFSIEESGVKLPATCLAKHKFDHETEEYLYVASDQKPRLYRAPLLSAYLGTDWENIYNSGELAQSTGGILSMVSAFNKLFLGARKNKIHRYQRTQNITLDLPTDYVTEEVLVVNNDVESLSTSTLANQHIDEIEPVEFGIKCLEVGKNQVFAGVDKKPEIYAYSEIFKSNPENPELWSNTLFTEVFMRDPAPAQFYTSNNLTNSRKSKKLSILKLAQETPDKTKDVMFIKGDNLASSILFEFSSGSDWEQLLSNILPSQNFIDVKAASIEPLTSFNNFTSLDGYSLIEGDLFILKDQTISGTNSIYNGVYIYNSGIPSFYTPTIEQQSTKLGFYVENGYINSGNRFLLNVEDYETSELEFYKPKYTLELEALNLSSGNTTESTIIDGNVYLGIDDSVINNSSNFSYTGYQGIEIQDVYGQFTVEYNTSNLIVKSGHNTITKNLITTGIIKNWSFRDDTVPSAPIASLLTWKANEFCSSFAAEAETDFNLYGVSYNKYIAKITPSQTGDPSIIISGLNLTIDQSSFIKIRVNISPDKASLADSYIDAYWGYEKDKYINFTSVDIQSADGYVDYIIKPTWKGSIYQLLIKFRNLPIFTNRPAYIKIDYIQILSDENIFDMNSTLSTIRVGVEGRDIKLWLGNQITPFIESKNFISFDAYNNIYVNQASNEPDYDKPAIKIGKINNYGGESLIGYSRLSVIVGDVYEPYSKEIVDFTLSERLPSTGGVRLFTYHNGTLYSITDGLVSTKFSDNPDDRQIKLFNYKSEDQYWEKEEANFERKTVLNTDGTYELYGVIRPMTSISYKGILFVSGQYGNIKYV